MDWTPQNFCFISNLLLLTLSLPTLIHAPVLLEHSPWLRSVEARSCFNVKTTWNNVTILLKVLTRTTSSPDMQSVHLCMSNVSLDVGVCVWEGGRAGGGLGGDGRAGLGGGAWLPVPLLLSWKQLRVNFLPFLELWGRELRIGQQLVNHCYLALPVLWKWRKRAMEGGDYRYSLFHTEVRMS